MSPSSEVADLVKRLSRTAGLSGPGQSTPRPIDWERWLDLAEGHRIAPLLARRSADDLPEDVRVALAQAYAREGRDALLRAAELRRVLDVLDGQVDFVVLKGAALLSFLYEDFAERAMWDVDILVQSSDDQEKAQRLLKENGFTTGKPLSGHHHAPSLKTEFHGLGVELHTNFVTPPLPPQLIDLLWGRRVMTGCGFYVLDPVGQLIHHAIHSLNDPLESPLLRNVFETAWLASRLTPPEQSDLKDLVARFQIALPVARGLAFAHALFDAPQILDAPRRSFYEFWCARRLEWATNLSFAGRVLRHVAHDHIRKMRRGADTRSIFPIIGIFFGWFFQSLEKRLRRATGPLERSPGHAVSVDHCVIFASAKTGEVHLLNPDAARVFNERRGPPAVVRELSRRGLLMIDTPAPTRLRGRTSAGQAARRPPLN